MTVTLSNTSTFGVPVVTVAWLMGLVAATCAHALLKKDLDDDFNSFMNIDTVFIMYLVMLTIVVIFGCRSLILYLSSHYVIAPSPLEHDEFVNLDVSKNGVEILRILVKQFKPTQQSS